MSLFDRRPWLRWTVPGAAAAVFVAGAALAPMGAVADSPLPARTAQELLVALQQPTTQAVSGTVAVRTDLGLPDLPMGMMPSTGPLALLDGDSTVRVWSDGPQRTRVALVERSAETAVVRNGDQAWVWSSARATADRYQLPEGGGLEDVESSAAARAADLPSTPQEAAEMALAAIDPSTEVTTSGAGTAAGRDAYELVLSPDDPATRVARVVISVDAETNVPLRVRVFSTTINDPAVDVGFTAVDYATPDPKLFEFVPPPGATVTDHQLPALTDAERAELEQGAKADRAQEPELVGSGWSAVVVADLPPDALADLAEAGQGGPSGQGADPATSALALLEALPKATGPWGSGRVLEGTLFSAIVTDDGRVALGAVGSSTLADALSGTR